MAARIRQLAARLEAGERALRHLGPTAVLERGYSITRLEGRREPLKDAARAHGGQTLITLLARGEVRSLVSRTTTEAPPAVAASERQPSLFDDDDTT
jgi:exonuclease VII large subunit